MNRFAPFAAADSVGWLRRLDPRCKLAWAAWVAVLCIVLTETWALLLLFAVNLALLGAVRISRAGWAWLATVLVLTAWGVVASQGFFYASAPDSPVLFTLLEPRQFGEWRFPGLVFRLEGAWYGLVQSLRLLSTTLAGVTLCLSTSPERLLSAMARLRIPAAVGFMTLSAMRFLPVMLDEWRTVRQARRLRLGGGGKRGGIGRRLRDGARMASALIVVALRRASTLATSITARGFDPAAPRTAWPELRLRPAEWYLLATLVATAAAAIVVGYNSR